MTAVINSVIVVTAVVSRRVRGMTRGVCGMMTMSVPAALERGHHRRRHTVVAQLEQQPATGRGRHVSGRNQRTHRNPGKQDRQTTRAVSGGLRIGRFGRREPVLHIVIQKPTPAIGCLPQPPRQGTRGC